MKSRLFLTVALFLFNGCGDHGSQSANVAPPTAAPLPSATPLSSTDAGQSVVECINQIPFLDEAERRGMLKAWKNQRGYKNFRMVEPPDFRIPEWVSREHYASDVERATGRPYDYGELSGAYGVVLFMVDQAAVDNNRFSIAVLIRRPGNIFSFHWIFEKTDLSQTTLGRHSGDVYLKQFLDDGSTKFCDIQWSRALGRWACELN